jgi:Ribbon-helix-helix protein, copG family
VRTTLSIHDEVLAAAKEAAKRRGTTLGELVEEALRRALAEPLPSDPLRLPVFRGGSGPRAGIPLRSNRALLEYLEQPDSDTIP